MIKSFAVLMFALLSGACTSTVNRLPVLASEAGRPYVLGAADTLQIVVYREPDLSGTYRVSDSGIVAMPVIGAIPAAGLSIDQFQQQLIERLQTAALQSPNVTVSISEYRPFFILGEVKSPGSYQYVPSMTVLTAVAIAGGFTYRASANEISVTRQTATDAPKELRASRDSRVLPGDVVYVFERHF